jgi:hypothetical protein
MSEPYWKDWQQTQTLGQQCASTEGIMRGSQVFTLISHRVSANAAQALLPVGVKLGPPGPDGRYLLQYTFGYQQFVRLSLSPPFLGISYLESILAVPGTFAPGRAGHWAGPFASPGRLYVNNVLAWISGRLIGFPKFLSRIATGESSCRIRKLFGALVVSLDCQLNGTIVNPFREPAYRDFVDFSRSAGVIRTPFGNYLGLVLRFDQDSALAQPVIARLEVLDRKFPGLSLGIHTFTGTDVEPLTAMRARLSWIQTFQPADEVPAGTPKAEVGAAE